MGGHSVWIERPPAVGLPEVPSEEVLYQIAATVLTGSVQLEGAKRVERSAKRSRIGRPDAAGWINEAATERTDGGRFDDLLAKAVAHYAASASGLKVPPRSVALSADTEIESWAPS